MTVKNYFIFSIFLILPIGIFLSYISQKAGGESYISYFVLLSTFLILFKGEQLKKNIFLALFLCFYFLFNLFYFEGSLIANARESILFINFLACLYSIKTLANEFDKIDYEVLRKFFYWFAIIFVALFFITAVINGKKYVLESGEIEREYFNGFVISHQFSYYVILLAFIFLKYEKWLLSLILIILSLIVGNRICILIILSGYFFYIEDRKNLFIAKLASFIGKLVLLIAVVLPFYFTIISPATLSWRAISSFLLDNNTIEFTSSRSIFWYDAINSLRSVNLFSPEFFFGLGPDSVNALTLQELGISVWMHNDFLQIYYCFGFVGICLYLHALYFFAKSLKSLNVVWIIVAAAAFNGFYNYGVIQLVIMLVAISKIKRKAYVNTLYPSTPLFNLTTYINSP